MPRVQQSAVLEYGMHYLTVRPLDGRGWAFEVDSVANQQIFTSGARAEAAAKALATRLSMSGEQAELTIYLRDGSRAEPPSVYPRT